MTHNPVTVRQARPGEMEEFFTEDARCRAQDDLEERIREQEARERRAQESQEASAYTGNVDRLLRSARYMERRARRIKNQVRQDDDSRISPA